MAVIVKGEGVNPDEITVVSGSDGYRLTTDANSHMIGGVTGLTGSTKWEKDTSETSISTSEFTTFWEKSEKGYLYGALFKLGDEDMEFQVEVDGEVVLSCKLKDELKDEFELTNGSGNSHGGSSMLSGFPFLHSYNSKYYKFEPPDMHFNSSIKLKLKSDKNNKDLKNYLITWKSA